MLTQQQPDTSHTTIKKCHFPCTIKNTSYLNVQRYSYGIWLWFTLCWRDIFRLLMLSIFLDKMLIDGNGLSPITLLIPHYILGISYIASNIYQQNQVLTIAKKPQHYLCNCGKFGVFGCVLCVVGQILSSILTILILPSSSYYSMHWGQDYGDVSRLFSDKNDVSKYTMSLLKYILNNKKEDIKKRIVAVNYYTTIMFADTISDKCLEQIDYFPTMHNLSKTGLFSVTFADIQKAGGYPWKCSNVRWFRTMLTICVVIYDVSMMAYLQHRVFVSSELNVFCWIYIVMDALWILFDFKYIRLYWYCHHMLPFVDDAHLIGDFPWDATFGSDAEMMENIDTLYHIMFDAVEKDSILEYARPYIHPDVAHIIAQFLWCPLPMYQNEKKERNEEMQSEEQTESNLDNGEEEAEPNEDARNNQINEIKVQFRQMMDMFKENGSFSVLYLR